MRLGFVWIVTGLVAGAIAAWVAVVAAAGGHGTYFPAAVLFPFAISLATWVGSVTPPLVAVALAQFPIYGFLVARLGTTRRVLLGIAGVHVLAAALAVIAVSRSEVF